MESNGVGGGQVRRVNLVYFLSRSGHVDHPHLLRVHHLSRNGVFLRDVKRWLANARGDAMPDTFSWSCKRRYKNGYVWQDLLHDDLITPISDNEYVLKGSEILLSSPKEDCLLIEKKAWGTRKSVNVPQENFQKPSEKILKESPVFCSATTSTITEESTSNDVKKQVSDGSNETGSGQDLESGRPSVSSTMSSSSYTKSNKSYTSVRASNVLRNLMKCGGLDSNDAVLVPVNKSRSEAFGPAWENERKHNARKSYEGRTWSGIKMKETLEFCEPKVNSSMVAPSCSQCGKLFKPEKMLTHMKLCQGMKHSSAMIGNNISNPRQQRCRNIS